MRHRNPAIALVILAFAMIAGGGYAQSQPPPQGVNVRASWEAFQREQQQLERAADGMENLDRLVWWRQQVLQGYRSDAQTLHLTLGQLLFLTLDSSQQIKVFAQEPRIVETSIREAQAGFDWSRFVESYWNGLDEPVGNTLTIGGPGDRFQDQQFTGAAGMRRRTITGGELEVAQRVGFQNNNSQFFVPNHQATTQLSVGFSQPLLRGRGKDYNQSLIVLAGLSYGAAREEFSQQLQTHLLEVVQAYWALYMERAQLAQQLRLYEVTRQLVGEIEARQVVDAQPTQLISARAAMDRRRDNLLRIERSIRNAETRLRALCNHVELGDSHATEIVPIDTLESAAYLTDVRTELATALHNRPEIAIAFREIQAASVKKDIAQNELLPQLNLITQAYLSGLEGQNNIGQAWANQFNRGAPSYTVGLAYEVPLGNRAARARADRRLQELRQVEARYRLELERIKAQVDVAVGELETAYGEIRTKAQALYSATREAEALRTRWQMLPKTDGTSSLSLESLLAAQQRIADTEAELTQAQLVYTLSISNLLRTNGTLLQVQELDLDRF